MIRGEVGTVTVTVLDAEGMAKLGIIGGRTAAGTRSAAKPQRRAELTPEQEHRRAIAIANLRLRHAQPCVWLGELSGRTHKKSCGGDATVESHLCRCPQRQEFGRWLARSEKWLPPQAIAAGACRDFDRKTLMPCQECPLYRAGLLPAD